MRVDEAGDRADPFRHGGHCREPTRVGVAYADRLDLVDRYLELGLALGRHLDGLVDFSYGSPALAERVEREPPRDPAALVRDADALLADVAGGDGLADASRRRWLESQLSALRTVAGRLAGEEIAYAEEVERCYGVRPERTPEERFAAAHRRLDEALPGSGDLGDRFRAWQATMELPPETVEPALTALADDFRQRAAALLELPPGEGVAFELVADEPWAAYNYYLGGLRSRIAVNTDVPLHAHSVGELVAHETYPGHHAEHATKEAAFVRDRGWLEESIALTATPQSLVSEAIAEVALDVLLGPRAHAVTAALLTDLGVAYDAEVAAAVLEARDELRAVALNAALLIHEDGGSEADGVEYVRRWSLHPEERAAKTVEFVMDTTWRAYVACYSVGRTLARGYVAGERARFRRLLTEQLTPADLAAAPETAGAGAGA